MALTLDYDYFLVCSFEFTCDGKRSLEPQEIIEFCVLKFCVRSQTVQEKFYSLVKPQHPVNSKLSTFCKMLTNISDRKLLTAPSLPDLLVTFDRWMWKQGLFQSRFIFVPYTHFDLQHMMLAQCKEMGYHCPAYFFSWIHLEELLKANEKKQVSKKPAVKQIRRMNSQTMLTKFGVKQEGRQHSAADNCTNTVNLIKSLLERGVDFTGKVWETFLKKRSDSNIPEDEVSEEPELDPKEEGIMELFGRASSRMSGRCTPSASGRTTPVFSRSFSTGRITPGLPIK